MKKIIYLFIMLLMVTAGVTTEGTIVDAYGWGYKKAADNKPPEIGKYKELLEGKEAVYREDTTEKVLYLTFDNGYEQGYTADILDILRTEKVPAAFFVTGHYVDSEPGLVNRMAKEGHLIGNHSVHHPDFTALSKQEVADELEQLASKVAKISAQKEMRYVRPPRGTFNEQTLQWADELNYTHVFWSLAFKDWETNKQQGSKYAYDQIMKQIHPGAIILLHTVSEDNAEALRDVIRALKQEGYVFKSLDDLMLKKQIPKDWLPFF